MFTSSRLLLVILLVFLLVLHSSEAKKKRKNRQDDKSMVLRQKETNVVEFVRLAVMRLIFGIATTVGFGEEISDAVNGVFVPPGVDEEDDYTLGGDDFVLIDRGDDYDY